MADDLQQLDTDEPGITAYHGSPHDFPQFDLSKIGTGEGAQAFGHGLYFAENEPVAIGYRNKLSEGTYKTDTGEIFDPYKNLEHMNVRVAAYKGIDPAIERAQGLLQSDPYDDRVHRDLEKLYALKAKNAAPHKGHMYEVQINAHPDHFLDWDKPISEQSEHVQKAIRHIAGQLDIDPFEHLALAAVVGRHPRSQTYSPRGEDLHTDIDEILSGKEHASKALHAAGIKGIRYLDAGSRPDGAYALHISHKGIPYTDPIPMKTFQQAQNHAKEYAAKGYDTEIKENGSRNYVVFDDKLVNVKRKYAKGGTVRPSTTVEHTGNGIFDVFHGDKKAGTISLARNGEGNFVSAANLDEPFIGKGIGHEAYNLIEQKIGRKIAPSPLGISPTASKFWIKRLKSFSPEERQQLYQTTRQAGSSYGIPERDVNLRLYGIGGSESLPPIEENSNIPKGEGGSIVQRALMLTSKKA